MFFAYSGRPASQGKNKIGASRADACASAARHSQGAPDGERRGGYLGSTPTGDVRGVSPFPSRGILGGRGRVPGQAQRWRGPLSIEQVRYRAKTCWS
jgi:hypothetical protein